MVLLVEDESMLAAASARALRRVGFEVLQAYNGDEAMEQLAANRAKIRAVVLDMVMPGMGGHEVLTRIRDRYPTLPVLVSSGHAELGKLEALSAMTKVAVLAKPYTMNQLRHALDKLADVSGDDVAEALPSATRSS